MKSDIKNFPGKFSTISEQLQEPFFLESAFVETGNSGSQTCKVRKKDILQRFFGTFEILKHLLLSQDFPESICTRIFSLVVGSNL